MEEKSAKEWSQDAKRYADIATVLAVVALILGIAVVALELWQLS